MTIFSSISEVSITENSPAIFFDKKTPENNRIIDSFELTEDAISSLFNLKLIIKFPFRSFKEDNLKDILNQKIQIKIIYNKLSDEKKEKIKYLTGLIKEVSFVAFEAESYFFELKVVPPLYQTKLNNAFRCWNNTTAKEVISEIINGYSKEKINFEFIITKPTNILNRRNIIQYGETDYQFICRLLHEEHLNYVHLQSKEDIKLVITDDLENKVLQENIKNTIKVQLSHSILNNNLNTYINNFFGYRHTLEDQIQHVIAQFKDPRDIENIFTSESKLEGQNINTFYKKTNHFKSSKLQTDSLSSFYTENELIRKNSLKNRITFSHHLNFLSVGEVIEFVYKSSSDQNAPIKLDKYFIAGLRHTYQKEPHVANEAQAGNYNYQVDVMGYPVNERFIADYANTIADIKLPALTTAIIFGKTKDELVNITEEADHYVGVVFDWPKMSNSDASKDQKYILARVSQFWASKKSGALFNPQPGDEVLVAFLNNDIEQPVIVRYFYNSTQLPPKLSDQEDKTGLIYRGIGFDSSLEKNVKFAFIDDSDNEVKNSASILLTEQGLIEETSRNLKMETTEIIQSKSTKDTIIESEENLKTKSTKDTVIESVENFNTKSTKDTVIESNNKLSTTSSDATEMVVKSKMTITASADLTVKASVADINEISIK